jgi:adenine-specific DNA-methyltransferase
LLFTIDALNPFTAAVADAARSGNAPRIAFIVTDSLVEYQSAGDRLPAGIETVQLYQDYLSNYLINREDAR